MEALLKKHPLFPSQRDTNQKEPYSFSPKIPHARRLPPRRRAALHIPALPTCALEATDHAPRSPGPSDACDVEVRRRNSPASKPPISTLAALCAPDAETLARHVAGLIDSPMIARRMGEAALAHAERHGAALGVALDLLDPLLPEPGL